MSVPRDRFKSNTHKKAKAEFDGLNLEEVEIDFLDADSEGNEVPLNDLDTFIVPARDSKGFSEPFHLSLPPIVLRHVDHIIRSHRFPYLRRGDLVRHAIVRHIRWLISIRESIPRHMLIALEAMMEDCRESEQRIRVQEALARIEERVKFHLEQGDTGEALRLLSVMRARVDESFTDYWGKEVKRTLDEKFFKPYLSVGAVLKTGKQGAVEGGQ